MFVDVRLESGGQAPAVLVPSAAVQNLGDRAVVYVADAKQPGQFVERPVRLGDRAGNATIVLAGVQPGETVVTNGSFLVRAERDRLGLGPTVPSQPRPTSAAPSRAADTQPKVQEAKVLVTQQGYEPEKLMLRAGVPARITFVRTTDKTCGTEVVFPSLNITRPLPLNEPVVIEFTPNATGEIGFVCGMDMLRGSVVVQ
jgi:hypothetical protein